MREVHEKNIKLQLSEKECEAFMDLCGRYGITVSMVLENFIGDLTNSERSNGSDERILAESWFQRCWFGMTTEENLLKFIMDNFYDVDEVLEAIEIQTLETISERLERIEELSIEKFGLELEKEEIEVKLLQRKEELENVKKEFLLEYPKADWEKELEKAGNWIREKRRLMEE